MYSTGVIRRRAWLKAGLVCAGLAFGVAPAAAAKYNLYVLEEGINQVQVVQTDDDGIPETLGTSIPVGNIASEAKATPDHRFVWVPNGGDGTVTVINTDNNTTQTFSLAFPPGEPVCTANNFAFPCTFPGPVVFNLEGTRAFVLDAGDFTVKIVDTHSFTVLNIIAVGNFPAGLARTPEGTRLYVTNLIDNTVSVINAHRQKVIATIPIPGGNAHVTPPTSLPSPTGVAVSHDGNYVYVTDAFDNNLLPGIQPFQPSTVSVISTWTNTVVNTIPSGGFVATAVAFIRRHPLALVANSGTDSNPDDRLGVINTAKQTLQSVITLPAPIVGPAEVDPEHRVVYVPTFGNGAGESIVTLGLPSLSIVNIFTLLSGSFPASIAVIPIR